MDRRNDSGPRIYNDVKFKKDKRNKMMKEMINKGGKSKIRENSRKYTTTKTDFKVSSIKLNSF